MRGARSLGQKLAPQEFLADLFWAAHEILGQPSVAFVSIVVWVLPVLVQRPREFDAKTFVLDLAFFYSVGWVGAERLFFLRRQKGQAVTLDTLLRAAVATTAALTLLALLAKGATGAFYLRERPARPDVVGAPL